VRPKPDCTTGLLLSLKNPTSKAKSPRNKPQAARKTD
jgi:hypothetical protein